MIFNPICRLAWLFFASLLPFFSTSQVNGFQKTYGGSRTDVGDWVIETPQGYLITGATSVSDYDYDALLLHVDKTGQLLWQKRFGDPEEDFFTGVVAANDSSFIAIGYRTDTAVHLSDIWLVAVDAAGEVLWQKTMGVYNRSEYPIGPIVPMHDGYVFAGTNGSTGFNQKRSTLTRIDNSGDTRWSIAEYTTQPTSPTFARVQFIENEEIFTCGGGGSTPGFFMRRDAANAGFPNFTMFDGGNFEILENFHRSPDGSFVMSGKRSPQTPDAPISTVWMQRYVPGLGTAWAKQFTVPGWQRHFQTMQKGPDGSIYMTISNIEQDAILLKLTAEGQIVWAKSFSEGQHSWLNHLLPTSDGGLLLVGLISEPGTTNSQIWLLKTDAEGRCPTCCSVERTVEVVDIVVPPLPQSSMAGEDYVGTQAGVFDFGTETGLLAADFCDLPRPVATTALSFCPGDSVVVNGTTYSQPGEVSFFIPSTTDDCDTLARFVLTELPQPTLTDSIFFAPGDTVFLGGQAFTQPGTVELVIPSFSEACDTLAVYFLNFETVGTHATRVENFKIYPNPLRSGEQSLRLEGADFEQAHVSVHDLRGRLVSEGELRGSRVFLKKTDLPGGVFYLKFFENGKMVGVAKVVVVE